MAYEKDRSYYIKRAMFQKGVRKELDKRGITELVHFTDNGNIKTIRKYGLLSRNELEKRKIEYFYNDDNRFDGNMDAICLSVTNVNLPLLHAKLEEGCLEDPVIIVIDSSILCDLRIRAKFFSNNAASYDSNGGYKLDDFRNMFDGDYDDVPSDAQAEIQIEDEIPLKYIKGFYYYRSKSKKLFPIKRFY